MTRIDDAANTSADALLIALCRNVDAVICGNGRVGPLRARRLNHLVLSRVSSHTGGLYMYELVKLNDILRPTPRLSGNVSDRCWNVSQERSKGVSPETMCKDCRSTAKFGVAILGAEMVTQPSNTWRMLRRLGTCTLYHAKISAACRTNLQSFASVLRPPSKILPEF